jgi:hypothetical protein
VSAVPKKRIQVAAAIVAENLAKEPKGSTPFASTFLSDVLAAIREQQATIERLTAEIDNANELCIRDLDVTEKRAERAEAACGARYEENVILKHNLDLAEAALAERERMLRLVCDAFGGFVDCPLETGCHYEGESGVPCGKCIVEHFRDHEFGDGLIGLKARAEEGSE